jgi:transcriptional regulator with XRE-family HTH domain
VKSKCRQFDIVLYLPFDHTDPHTHKAVSPEIVYETDSKQVITSDLIFVLCVAASFGVGQENQIALSHGIPVVYLVQNGLNVSRMLVGSPTRSRTIQYDDLKHLLAQLDEFLPDTAHALLKLRQALGAPSALGVGERLKDLRSRMDLKVETLADVVGVAPKFISKLEEDAEGEGTLTLAHIKTLATFLGQSIEYLLVGAVGRLDERQRRSRENLRALARETEMIFSDFERLWGAYVEDQRERIGFVAETRKDSYIVGKEQWRVWYTKMLEKRSAPELEF